MPLKDILRSMVNDYFVICTGIVICQLVLRMIFSPNVGLSVNELILILVGGAVFTLPHLAFLSYKVLTKKQWIQRRIIHFITLMTTILIFAHLFGWLSGSNLLEHLVFIASVLVVYLLVGLVSWQIDHSNSEAINRRLKELRDEDED